MISLRIIYRGHKSFLILVDWGGPGGVAGAFVGGRISQRACSPRPQPIERPWRTQGAPGQQVEPADAHRLCGYGGQPGSSEGQAPPVQAGQGRKGQALETWGPCRHRGPHPVPS